MPQISRSSLHLLTGLASCFLGVGSVEAAEWLFLPSARLGSEYTDNPRLLREEGTSTTGATGELAAVLKRRTERSELLLRPRATWARYRNDDLLNNDNQYLSMSLSHVRERTTWNASAELARDTTLTSELELTGLVAANRRHEGIAVTTGSSYVLTERVQVGLQTSWNDNHYVDSDLTSLVDYDYRALSVFSNYTPSDRSTLSITAHAGKLNVPESPFADKEDASLRLGWRSQLSALWMLDASVGPSYLRSSIDSEDGLVFASSVQRQDERWIVGISAAREVTPTGRGSMIKRENLAITANRRLTERMSATAVVRAVRNEELLQAGAGARELEYGRVDLQMNWRMDEHWTLAASASALAQRFGSSDERAENYQAFLSIIWNGQAQSL